MNDGERILYSADVEPDSHNDQLAAQARDDLRRHIASTMTTLKQGGEVECMAVIATAFIDNAELYPMSRLASLLAAALIELARKPS